MKHDVPALLENGGAASDESHLPMSEKRRLQLPIFNPDDYRNDLTAFDLTEQQENELLETLWNIMSSFVTIGFGLDSVQLFSTLEYDGSQENAGTDSDNSINNKPTQQDQSIANTFSTEAQQEANHE